MRGPAGAIGVGLGLLALGSGLGADATLKSAFEAGVLAAAARVSCSAQVWAPDLLGIPAGWSIGAAAPLPKPGAWDLESVLLKRDGTTATAQAKVRVKLTALVGAWTVMQPLAPGSPLDPSQLHWDLYDPRSLTAPPLPRAIPDGATAGRSLAAGQVLCAGDVNDASTMHAGQRVTLMIKEDSIEASDEGVLLDSGGQGSLLRAQHLRSGKLVRGRLSGHVLLVEG